MTRVLPQKSGLKQPWVSLSLALSWVSFDNALELPDLLVFARGRGWSDDELRGNLTAEWKRLADYACEKSARIRAIQRYGHSNVELTTDDLQNFVHVGWEGGEQPVLALDRFPFTFAGGFRQNVTEVRDGFLSPVIWRHDLAKYKRLRSRMHKSPADKAIYEAAEEWLRDELAGQRPHTGSRLKYLEVLTSRFELPKYRAQEIWTKITKRLGWPQRGRPKKSEKKSHSDFPPIGILSRRSR